MRSRSLSNPSGCGCAWLCSVSCLLEEEHFVTVPTIKPPSLHLNACHAHEYIWPQDCKTRKYELLAEMKAFLAALVGNLVFTFACTTSNEADEGLFSEAFGVEPLEIDNADFSPLDRPGWWWIGGKEVEWKDAQCQRSARSQLIKVIPKTQLLHWESCVLPGYWPCVVGNTSENHAGGALPLSFQCLTSKSSKQGPEVEPGGLEAASAQALQAWQDDMWAQEPRQYELSNMVIGRIGSPRRLLPCEEELLMGFPRDYTSRLSSSDKKDVRSMRNRRHTLLGNSWSLNVTVFIAENLVVPFVEVDKADGDSRQYHLARKLFDVGREQCPYLHDLSERMPVLPRSLPPDWVEMHAYESGSTAEQVQTRKHTTYHLDRGGLFDGDSVRVGPQASLPKGLPPDVHFIAGCSAESPLDVVQEVPDDFRFALRKTIALGKAADAWRRQRFDFLLALVKEPSALHSHWSSRLSANARQVAPGVKPHSLDLLAHSICWPDVNLPQMAAEGAKPLFCQDPVGIFRGKITVAGLSEEEFNLGSGAYMNGLLARNAPSKEQQDVVWELSEKERKKGTLTGYYCKDDMDRKYGAGRWRALSRHAILQNEKWRLIDDGKAGQHNSTYAASETIHTTCTAAGVAAVAPLPLSQVDSLNDLATDESSRHHSGLCAPAWPASFDATR